MNHFKHVVGIIILICLNMLTGFAEVVKPVISYYVSVNGDDLNNGSRDKPFKTIQKLNSIRLQPNTKVYLQGGGVFRGPLLLEPGENGTQKQPVFITSYGKGVAIINGDLKEAIIIKSSFVVVDNINTKGAGRKEGNTASGILFSNSSYSKVINITTEGFQKSGIELNNCHNMLLDKVLARNNGFCGIYVNGVKSVSKNINIENCQAENNAGDPSNLSNHSGNGIFAAGSDSVTIRYCTATNNGWDMPRKGNGPVGIWGYDCDHLLIEYCISYKNKTQQGASDGGGFDFDGGVTNSIIQYCLSYDNQGSGYGLFQFNGAPIWSNNIVRYCVSINDGQTTPGAAGFLIWNDNSESSGLNTCKIYNNVVYNTTSPAIRFDFKSANINFLFANNIFVGKNEIINGPSSGEKFIGNVWWNIPGAEITFRGYKNLKEWAAATGQEMLYDSLKGSQVNPLLKGPFTTNLVNPHNLLSLKGFQLQTASPLKNKGIPLDSNYGKNVMSKDFFGNEIKNAAGTPGIHELSR